MLANLQIPNSHKVHSHISFPWFVLQEGAIQFNSSDVDGYGNFDADLLGEQFELLSSRSREAAPLPDVAAEDFEAIYTWFYS